MQEVNLTLDNIKKLDHHFIYNSFYTGKHYEKKRFYHLCNDKHSISKVESEKVMKKPQKKKSQQKKKRPSKKYVVTKPMIYLNFILLQ